MALVVVIAAVVEADIGSVELQRERERERAGNAFYLMDKMIMAYLN